MDNVSFDAKLYPACHAYLSGLPNGFDSYADCLTASAFLKEADADFHDVLQAESVPQALRRKLAGPHGGDVWLSSVSMVLANLMIHDRATKSVQDYEARMFDLNARMFASNAFRSLMHLVSPSLLLLGAAKRWSTFYKGPTTLTTVKAGKNSADVRLGFPPNLFPPLYVTALAQSFRAAAAATRPASTHVKTLETSDTHAMIRIDWT